MTKHEAKLRNQTKVHIQKGLIRKLNKQGVYHLTKTSDIYTYNTLKGQRWGVFGHRSQPPVQNKKLGFDPPHPPPYKMEKKYHKNYNTKIYHKRQDMYKLNIKQFD